MLCAILLVAGRGNRLRPITDTIPKALVKVRNKAVVEYIVEDLLSLGIKKIIFVTGYLGYKIEEHFSSHVEFRNFAFVQQTDLDGTGGAVRAAIKLIDSDFVVVFGDSYFENNSLNILINSAFSNAICTVRVNDPHRYGIVLSDEEGNVLEVEEKPLAPKTNIAIAGAYKFSHKLLSYFEKIALSQRGEYEVPDAIRAMIDDKICIKSVSIGGMIDIGTLEQLDNVNSEYFSFSQ